MTEEQRQNLREVAARRFAVMDAEKLAAFKEKCAANGRKSWAMRSAADKAAQIARINTPEVRKRASDANKAKHRVMPGAATRLKQLDALKEQGLITESEYTEKRGKILAEL